MPLPLLAGLGIAGLGGLAGFFGNPSSNRSESVGTTNVDQTGWQNNVNNSSLQSLLESLSRNTGSSNTSNTSTPTLGGPQQQLMDQLTRQYSGLAQGNNVNLNPYAAQQTQNINRNSQAQSDAVRQIMAARGLSTSPVAATSEANVQSQRIGQISNLQASLPLLQNDLRQQNLGSAASFLSSIPRAMTQSGTNTFDSTQTGSQTGSQTGETRSDTNSGNNVATHSNQIGYGEGQQGGGVGGAAGGLAALLAALFGGGK